ncbi:MAG: hypothetical protein HKN17_10895, partial [Rhodothermales bacterium]|nr:hypothetical protein [Rhodothermales bacterium]
MRSLYVLLTAAAFCAAPILNRPAAAQSMYTDTEPTPMGFGGSVAISDGDVFVGSAPIGWPAGDDPAGEVYRYTRSADGAWSEAGRLMSPGAEFGDQFGRSVVAANGMLYVGAPAQDAVYVFESGADGWRHSSTLKPQHFHGEGYEFGGAYARGGYRAQTIAAFDGHVAVTSYNADEDAGVVHVFDESGNQVRMIAAGAWSVAGHGHHLFVGTPMARDGQGGLHVYGVMSDGSLHAHTVDVSMLAENANVGFSLAYAGGRLYVGAPGQGGRGAVLVYEMSGGGWSRTGMLSQPDSDDMRSAFGQSLSASGTDLLVGANGAVFVYDTADPSADPAHIDRPEGQ